MSLTRLLAAAAAPTATTAAFAAPDLTFSLVSTRHVVYRRGSEMIFHFILIKQGNQFSTNPVISVRLSPDSTITLTDTFMGEKLFAGLPPGGSLEQYISGTLPSNVAPGTHFAGLYANSQGDGNIPNNGVADPVQIEVYCPGDTNGDQAVNFADLNTVLSQFGGPVGISTGDVNDDLVVNFADLNIVLSAFGQTGC